MCRKLTVTGWVLLVQDADQGRVLVALVVSVAFLALRLSMKPLGRCAAREDLNVDGKIGNLMAEEYT